MRLTSQFTGDKELIAKFKRLNAVVRGDTLERAATAGILPIQNEAIRLAPYKEGNLKRSIHTETTEKRATFVEVTTGTDVEYAARQEFGFHGADALGRHYNQEAHPYLRPAYDTKKHEAERETQEALKDLINTAV